MNLRGGLALKSFPTRLALCLSGAVRLLATLSILSAFNARAQQYWRIDGTSATWTSANWGNAPGGPFTNAFVPNSNVIFQANSAITYVTSTNIGNLTLTAGNTVVTAAGTLTTGGNVRTFDIATGSTLTWTGQTFSTAAGTGFIKNGGGIWNMGASGSLYGGGFTLNDGTVIVSGNNVFGNGLLTVNGGTIQSSGGRTFASSSMVIGGDFSITGTGDWTMNMPVSLGTAVRTINMTATGTKTWNGVVSGVGGGLTFTGTGTHVFTNAGNTFSGPIEVQGGEVEFTTAGSLGTGTSITADGGRVSFRNTYTIDPSKNIFVGDGALTSISTPGGASVITYNGVIANKSGEVGSWAKQGAGNLILGGANTFTGSASINNGTLTLNNLNALSSASTVTVDSTSATLQLNVAGENTWQLGTGNIILSSGGTLRQLSGLETDIALINQTIQLTGTGGTINAPGDSRIYAQGNITGSGALNKAGGGELRFRNGAKTYTGATNITNGRIRIDDDGIPTGTSAINLNAGAGNNAAIRFGQSGVATFSLGAGGSAPINMTGAAGSTNSIEFTDTGQVTLTNPISIAGPGTGNFRSREAGAVLALTGPITGAGPLAINQGSTGNPTQLGTVFINGNAAAFAGNVNVVQSTLRLGQNTTLGANAFNLQAPATLMLDIASPTVLGNINATTATLANGSTILPNFLTGPNGGTTTYDLITTTGGVTDNGATVQSTGLVQLSLDLTNPNILRLIANVDYSGSGLLGLNNIQTAVGQYLNAPGAGPALAAMRGGALNQLSNAAIAAYFDGIAAEEYGGMVDSALLHAQDQLRSITRFAPHLQNRLCVRDALGVRSINPGEPTGTNWNAFSDLRIIRGGRSRNMEIGGYNASGQAYIAGADRVFSDNFAAGFFGSYEHSRTEFDQFRGWSDGDTLGVGAMASWLLPSSQLTFGAQQLRHSFDMARYSALGTTRSSPEGNQTGLILQGSTQLGSGRLSVLPMAHLQYNRLSLDGFSESGAANAQTFERMTFDSLQGGIGIRAGYTIPGHLFTLRPEVFAEYRHELLDGSQALSSTFLDGSGPLNIVVPGRANSYAAVGGGLHACVTNSTSAFVQYEARIIDNDPGIYSIYGGFRWNFEDSLLRHGSLALADTEDHYSDWFRRTPVGSALDAINLRALLMLQYDHLKTKTVAGSDPDPQDPRDMEEWFVRRFRLSAERDLGMGFNFSGAFQFSEDIDFDSISLFNTNLTWTLFEPFSLSAGLDRVPLDWEETTSSVVLKTVERSVASRVFNRLGGDDIGRFHWGTSAFGRFRELYTSNTGPINRYDFHYHFTVANPREAVDAPWEDDDNPMVERWPDPSLYLRLQNELHTPIGQFDVGVDLADIPTFRARSEDMPTGAQAATTFVNWNRGWLNLTLTRLMAKYQRDQDNGGATREPTGFTITPSMFITPQMELVGMYSEFQTDGDFAIRLNQAVPNAPTYYPDNRRYDRIDQWYFGVNHYLDGDDLKVMYGIEQVNASGARADRPVSAEDAWGFRFRVQIRH